MGAARHNPSAGYSLSLYALTALSSFSDTACSGLQTGNPDMAIHQCCYNLSDFISFWILSPKWKRRGERREEENPAVWFSHTYAFCSVQQIGTRQKTKSGKVPGVFAPPISFIFKTLIYFIWFLLQQRHRVLQSRFLVDWSFSFI